MTALCAPRNGAAQRQLRRQGNEFRSLVSGAGAAAGRTLRQAHAQDEATFQAYRGKVEAYEVPYLQQRNNAARLDNDILRSDPVGARRTEPQRRMSFHPRPRRHHV